MNIYFLYFLLSLIVIIPLAIHIFSNSSPVCNPQCKENSKCVNGNCVCDPKCTGNTKCVDGVCACSPTCEKNSICTDGVCVCNTGWQGKDCTTQCYDVGENPFSDSCSKLNGCCDGLKLCFDGKNFTCQKTCNNDTKPTCEMSSNPKLKNCCSIPEICPKNTGSCKDLTCCELCGNTQKCPNLDCTPCLQDTCYEGNKCSCCAVAGDSVNRHTCSDGTQPKKCCDGQKPDSNGICPLTTKKCTNGISVYDSCICNTGYGGPTCDDKTTPEPLNHCTDYSDDSIFVSHGRGAQGCYKGNGLNMQNMPTSLDNGKISAGVYKCGTTDITLSGGTDKACVFTSTIGTIDMSKVTQIDFDLFAENCEKDWCSLWLDPSPYPKVADSGKSGEIDLVEIMSDQTSGDQSPQALRTNFGGAYGSDAHQMLWNTRDTIDMKNIKKHITLRKSTINGSVIAYVNICDGQNPCPDLAASYTDIAWINLSNFPVGDPDIPEGTEMMYNLIADIWKTDQSPDGSYSGGSNNATDCKFTIRNLKIKYA